MAQSTILRSRAHRGLALLGSLVTGSLLGGLIALFPGTSRDAGIAAGLGLLIGLTIFGLLRQIEVQCALRGLQSELRALWSLSPIASRTRGLVLPQLGNASVDPELAFELCKLLVEKRPTMIVEFGAGSSTLLMGLTLEALGLSDARILALEHDSTYAETTRRMLASHGVTMADVWLAPLEAQQWGNWAGSWYSRSVVEQIPDAIDLVLVDGPPAYNWSGDTELAPRFPALPALEGRLNPGCIIVVDDTQRRGEQHIVRSWLSTLNVTLLRDGGGYIVLQIP